VYKKANFVFLVVGHTKNAADSLFNSLKHEYHKRNLFTMQDLLETLNVFDSVVVPTIPEDFLGFDVLTDDVYCDLSGMVKQNHMFSCHDNGTNAIIIQIQESNLDEHKDVNHKAVKRTKHFNSVDEFRAHCNLLLLVIKCLGLNPYKAMELWKNYHPVVPVDFHGDVLYVEPNAEIMSKVKDERMFRLENRKVLKTKKYGDTKEAVKDVAIGGVV
jgi:hypothetical protein